MWAHESPGIDRMGWHKCVGARSDGGLATARHDPADGALASLAGSPMSSRFCAWRGASGQRYVASVFAADRSGPDGGLPAFDACLLIAVARGDVGRHILFVCTVEGASDRLRAIARGFAAGAEEWHVHFLAETSNARTDAAADLASRHLSPALVA